MDRLSGLSFQSFCPPGGGVKERLPDVKLNRTVNDTSSATHTGNPAKVLRKIVELVHQSLPGSLSARRPWIMAGGFKRIDREEAGIPVSDPLTLEIDGLIGHVKAVTGGAEKGTNSTADTFLMGPVPEWTFDHEVQPFFYSFHGDRTVGLFKSIFFKFFEQS